jgi:glycosyltransferase involved in cell wall biosynthesis
MISIIIPLYNKELYVKKTIDSVLSQNYKAFELIIVNDGSLDDSLAIVEQFEDERIHVYSKINEGVSLARNFGVGHSNFEFIAFLDADDYWEANYLESMMSLIKKYPDANIYGSSFKIQSESKFILPQTGISSHFKHGYIDYISILDSNLNCSCLHTSAIIVKKKAFDICGGFHPKLKSGEDVLLWISLCIYGKCAYVNENICIYNFDVDPANRAVFKVFKPEEFYIFYFKELETKISLDRSQKRLLDRLRLKNLRKHYILSNKETVEEINLIDSRNLGFLNSIYYKTPPNLVRYLLNWYLKVRTLIS